MSDSPDDRIPLDMGEHTETTEGIDLEALFGVDVPAPSISELQNMIAMQGRTIATLQQRIFDLEMQIVDKMQLLAVEHERHGT